MDRSLTKIVKLLQSDDRTIQQAAAHVLGALGSKDAKVREALGETLANGDREVQLACLSALESLGAGGALDRVMPMLDATGDIGHRAMRVIAGEGASIIPELRKRFDSANDVERRRILSVAGRVRGAAGLDLILMALEAGHADQVVALGQRLASELEQVSAREQANLVTRIEKYLTAQQGGKGVRRPRNPSTEAAAAAVDLLARVLGADAHAKLFTLSQTKSLPEVRHAALDALARDSEKSPLSATEVTKVLSYLKDRDYTHVVSPALELLERSQLQNSHAPALLRALEGNDPALRRFAVGALGQIDTPKVAKALVSVLHGDNPDLRERAAQSLASQKAATTMLLGELCEASDADAAWQLAHILAPHAPNIRPDQVRRLCKAAVALLEPGDARAEAVVSLLHDHHLDALAAECAKRVRALKKNREAGAILNLIRPLVREEAELPSELRYEHALAELMRGKKDVVREVRLNNPGLRSLETLLQEPGFDLLALLRKEKKVLTPEEYFLIGSHFAERSFGDRIFGGEILRWLVKTFPEDNFSSAAANKLVMEGFPPPPQPKVRAAKEREVAMLAAAEEKAAREADKSRIKEEQALQREAERAQRAIERAAARAEAAKAKKKAAKKTAKKTAAKKTAVKKVAKKAAKKKAAKKTAVKKVAKKKAAKKVAKKKAAKKVAKKKAAKKVAKKKVAKKKAAKKKAAKKKRR